MANDIEVQTGKDGSSKIEAPEFYLAALDRQNRENMNTALRPHGLKVADWRILSCLDSIRSLTVSDLAELTVVERSVASRLVDRMIERGFLRKEASAADRRYSEITLTEAGSEKLRQCDAAVDDLRAQLFAGMSEKDRENLLRLLKLLRKNVLAYQRHNIAV
ncbi:MAG: MarR family winged helix-turn-helix transcriptional regulator [Rhizobiaceae bacterium]